MSDKPYLGGSYEDANTIMTDVWGWVLVERDIKSVLDIGAGFGHCLKWFADNGLCQIKGIEGWPEAVEKNLVKGHIIQHDFTEGPAPIAQPFDLAWSAEFVEHVEERYIPNFMPAFRLARYAIITHAEPGQAGHHHVNCQTTEYWIDKFKEYGFDHEAEATNKLRRTDRWRAGWGRRTLTAFRRVK